MRTSTTALAVSLALILSFLTSSSARAEVAAVGAGTYENDSPAVTLSGDWALKTSTQDSAGSFAQLGGTGYAQISFTTSGIKWIARKSSSSGQADVYLDGVKVQTVDLYASATQYQQTVYEVSGLPETTHTLRIVRTGTKNTNSIGSSITLDAFIAPDIYPPSTPTGLTATPDSTGIRLTWTANTEPDLAGYRLYRANGSSWDNVADKITDTTYLNADLQPGTAYSYRLVALDNAGNESPRTATVTSTTAVAAVGAGTYENDSPAVTLSGDWALKTSTQDSAGSFAQLGGTGYAQISFTTSGIKWIARKSSSSGQADVYLDGVKVQTVDLYASATQYQQTVYEVSGLPETTHTLRIVRTGTKNTNSIGSSITLDAFIAPDIYPPSTPTGLTATPDSTGIRLTWTANTEPDLAGYRLYRSPQGAGTWVVVQNAMVTGNTLLDFGLPPSTSYDYRLAAIDTSDNYSARATTSGTSAALPSIPQPKLADCPAATTSPQTESQLRGALANANPGDVIRLAANTTYNFAWFTMTRSGTAAAPIWICGPKSAVIDGQGTSDGRGLRLDGVSYVNVIGFTMRNGSKGIQVKNSSHVIVSNLTLKHIGDEAIHLLANTTDSYVVGNIVDGTGVEPGRAFYGEGVYIGTARENRCQYSDCQPDRSDRNVIAFNQISNTTSETVEVKAGASDGWIFGNTLDGASMTSDRPSPIVIMGNRWVIAENVISHPNEDAIQVWTADYEQQFGLENQIFRNTLGTSVTGYTARIGTLSAGTMVGCDNDAGQLGVTNIACQK